MASIQEYLDLIKNAIYGKDVRQAIHDGIQQCYYDGKAGSTDLEARQRLDSVEPDVSSLKLRMSTAENDIDVLDSRVDQIVAPSGEAPSAAEVSDARVGADGMIYTNLGDAVRGQVTDLKSDLEDVATDNILLAYSSCIFRTSKSTWAFVSKEINLPSNTTKITIKFDSVITDSGTLPSNLIAVVQRNGETILNTSYVTAGTYGATTVIVSEADNVLLRFYTNTTSAINTSVTYTGLEVFTGTEKETYLQDMYFDGMLLSERFGVQSKNILSVDFEQGSLSTSNGNFVASSNITNTSTKELIPVEGNMEYTFSWDWNENVLTCMIYQYDSDGDWLGLDKQIKDSWTKRINSLSFLTDTDARYIRIGFYSNINTEYEQIVPKNPQLEIGGTPTHYMKNSDLSTFVDYEKVRNNRLSVPDYYFENNYLDDKISTARDLMYDANGNYDAFFFVTDLHWEINAQKSPALINYIQKKLNIQRLFLGGDFYDKWSEYEITDCMDMFRSAFSGKIYNVVGNHEYKGTYMTDNKIWYFLNSMADDITIGDAGMNFYYVDNPIQKVRYIVLNVYTDGGDDAVAWFDDSQQDWLEQTALNMEFGWTAVVFTHCLYHVDMAERKLRQDETFTAIINRILDSYEGNGEIACVIQGHTHIDRMTHTDGGIPVFITTCDKNTIWYDGSGNPDLYDSRVSGTITEQAFEIVVLDKKHRKVSLLRIGAPALNGVDDNIGSAVEIRSQNY